jgi:predicted enzyme related to lactoylglutathione lyase
MKPSPAPPHASGSIAHFDITGPQLEPLRSFYAAVFDWHVDVRGPGYASVATPDGGPNGGIAESPDAGLTIGIFVDDLDASLDRAAHYGGTVIMPPTDNGWVVKAQVRDPAGNLVTLIEGGARHR